MIRLSRQYVVAALLVALLTAPTFTSPPAPVFANDESVLKVVNEPIGVAAEVNRLYVTRPYCTTEEGATREVVDIAKDTNVLTPFATLAPRVGCFEEYIAVSPGKGGFNAHEVFVTQGSVIKRIVPNAPTGETGTTSTFTVVEDCSSQSHNGVTFDGVGSWGFDMIFTCADTGDVYRINSSGSPHKIATIADKDPFIEGPAVAPLAFLPYGGCIFVAAEHAGKVFAVCPPPPPPPGDGDEVCTIACFDAGKPGGGPPIGRGPTIHSHEGVTVHHVASWPGAENVRFVPVRECVFNGGMYFTAIFQPIGGAGMANTIVKFPPRAFAGKGGQAIVPSETGAGIALLTSGGPSLSTTLFHKNIGQHEGSDFCGRLYVKTRTDRLVEVTPPNAQGSQGKVKVIQVDIFSQQAGGGFPPFRPTMDIDQSTLGYGFKGDERSLFYCMPIPDENGDTYQELRCFFHPQRAMLHKGLPGHLTGYTSASYPIDPPEIDGGD